MSVCRVLHTDKQGGSPRPGTSVGWRAAAARSTVRTLPTICLWTRVGTGLQMSATRPSLFGSEERAGAVREPARSHGDPLLSTFLVSRGGGQVSREILEMEHLRVQFPPLSGLNCTRKDPSRLHIPNCSRAQWGYNPIRNQYFGRRPPVSSTRVG